MSVTTEVKKKSSGRSPRHRARELAMQGIYQWRVAGGEGSQIEQQIKADGKLGRYDKKLFSKILIGVVGQGADLEPLLTVHLDRPLSELDPVEYAVLMLGTFELSQHIEVPYKVVINEAVELAKTFGGEDGYKYVNGVLDKLAPQLRAVEFAAK
jgi:N utilization substance protein B